MGTRDILKSLLGNRGTVENFKEQGNIDIQARIMKMVVLEKSRFT